MVPAPTIRVVSGFVAVALALTLSGCIQQAEPGTPRDATATPDDAGTMISCFDAYPNPIGGTDIAEASVLPVDWPRTPDEAQLCSAAMLTEDSAIVEYVTSLGAEELLAYYEQSLAAYSPTISEGGEGELILRGAKGNFEFAIHTDDAAGTYFLAASLG